MTDKKHSLNIVFFYPSRVVGGAEFLFSRLTEYLSQEHNCYIVDYSDGIYRKINPTLSEENYITYEEQLTLPEESHIVSYPSEINRLQKCLKNNKNVSNLLLWSVHPDNFENTIPFKRVNKKLMQQICYPCIKESIYTLLDNNALVFMDGGINERYEMLYGCDKERLNADNYLPIPIVMQEEADEANLEVTDNTHINICWLGRLSEEKTYPLLKVIEDLNMIENIKINFDIIGEGSQEYMLDSLEISKHITSRKLGTIVDDLDRQLKKYDLLFAMGTSMLEGGRLKIPTILVDGSYTKMSKNYKYKWIFDTKDFVLGSFEISKYTKNNKLTMFDIIEAIKDKTKSKEIAYMCYDYVKQNHAIENISQQLVSYIQNSTLDLSTFNKLPINTHILRKMHNFSLEIRKGLK